MKLGLSSWVTPKTRVLARVTVLAPRPWLRERGCREGGVLLRCRPFPPGLGGPCGRLRGILFQFFFTVVRPIYLGTLSLAFVIIIIVIF